MKGLRGLLVVMVVTGMIVAVVAVPSGASAPRAHAASDQHRGDHR